jgi:hypothetical protein
MANSENLLEAKIGVQGHDCQSGYYENGEDYHCHEFWPKQKTRDIRQSQYRHPYRHPDWLSNKIREE